MADLATHFGILWSEGVAYLQQGRGSTNFVGLRNKSPFEVQNAHKIKFCNHLVPTAAPLPDKVHWEIFVELMKDPLVQAMLPLPKKPGQGCFYVDDPDDALGLYLMALSTLSSPIHRIVHPFWTQQPKQLQKELSTTNIQPLVLTQARVKDQGLIDNLAKLSTYEPRTLVMTGDPGVMTSTPLRRIQTSITRIPIEDVVRLPMENLGAAVIRRYCRNEPIDAPMEGREERRERQIRERTAQQTRRK